jgi:transposase
VIYVGMDLHVRNSYLHITDADGQVLKRGRVGNSWLELGQVLGQFAGPMRVCLENTTNSRAIKHLLERLGSEAGIDLSAQVLNSRKLQVIAQSVSKCDKLDAAVINELARSSYRLPLCYVPDDETFGLREHLRARADLVMLQTMIKNRVHALLHRRGILTPEGDLFARTGRGFLAQLELDEAGKIILDRFVRTLEQVAAAIGESERELKQVARRPRWSKQLALLQTMPGMGLVTGLTVLAELGDLSRFKSRAAVSNFSGLVPVIRCSNEKYYSGPITHRGSGYLRHALVLAAHVAVRYVPVYARIYHRIKEVKASGTAVVAVARRMLEDALTMLRKEEAFRHVPIGHKRIGGSGVAG